MQWLVLVYVCRNLLDGEQISMNVRMALTVVIRMQTVLILMVATPALVHLDSLETAHHALV